MEIRVLRYFIAVVRNGSISAAAHQLHISQPALSRQIMELESELEVTLFERGHRQIKLTQEGAYLFDRAQEIVALTDKTADQLHSKAVVSGTVNIGAGESGALQPVMDTLGKIIRGYPHVKVNLVSGDNVTIRQQLDAGLIEFGIFMGHENLTGYNTLPLQTSNRWGLIVPTDSQLAKKPALSPRDLVGQPLLTSAQTSRQDTFRQWAGADLNDYHFVGYYNLLYNAAMLVKNGACVALTYEDLVNTELGSKLVFRPLTPQLVDNNILVWRKDHQLANVDRLFIQEMREWIDDEDN